MIEQSSLEQTHEFELCGSTYTEIFEKYSIVL